MKKILIALFVLCCLALIGIYALVPAKINFKKTILVQVNQVNANRILTDDTKWNKWWPKDDNNNKQADTANHVYKNYYYSVNSTMLIGDSIVIKNNSTLVNSLLYVIPLNSDSISLQWIGESTATANPFKRFKNYLQRKQVENNVATLLQSLKVFLENKQNLYGISINQEKVTDTLLLATRFTSASYPETAQIYALIKNLKDYILKEGALETNNPMLHVIQDSGIFKTMVAIPLNKVIPVTGNFLFKRMVPGKILTTEVKGGINNNNNAIKTIELYMDDYHLMAPAISFQSLVTDRSKEADSTKWITKIYYPVM